MKLLGKTRVGGTSFDLAADTKRVARYTVPLDTHVVKLSVYVDGLGAGTGDQVMHGVIYTSAGGLVAQGDEVLVHDGQAAGWVDLTFAAYPGGVSLAAGDYDFGVHGGANPNTIRVWGDNRVLLGTLALTVTGNEITDASRLLGIQGDGRLNDSSYGIWPSTTNRCTNGNATTNVTGWTTGGTNTLVRSTARAKFGATSFLATFQSSATLADYALTFPAAGVYAISTWVWVPTAFTGTAVSIGYANLAGATTVDASHANANLGLRDQWQRIWIVANVVAGDLVGDAVITETGATAGQSINFGGFQVEQKQVPTPYVQTDGATATRPAGRVYGSSASLSTSTLWVAARIRLSWAAVVQPFGAGGMNPRVFSWRTSSGGADSYPNALELYYSDLSAAWFINDGTVGSQGIAATHAAGDTITLIAQWTPTTQGVSLNNGGMVSSARASTINQALLASVVDLGSLGGSDGFLNGEILWLAAGTGVLSGANQTAINAFGNNDPSFATMPGSPVFIWTADSAVASTDEGGRTNSDTYADGSSAIFGGATILDYDMSVFGTYISEPGVPYETDFYYGRLPFDLAQRVLDSGEAVQGSVRIAECGWHGTRLDPERGSFVIVNSDGPLAGLVGERLRITAGRGDENEHVVYAYCHTRATLNEDLSLTRRAFLALTGLGDLPQTVEVEVVA